MDDDFDYEFPDDPEPSHYMVDDEDDSCDEGWPTLRMIAQALNVTEDDQC